MPCLQVPGGLVCPQGDFKDISKQELTRIGTEALQRATLKELMAAVPRHYRNMIDTFFRGTEAERAGVAAWAAAMAPGSWLGETMRDRQVAAVVGDGHCRTLFVHAGFDDKILKVRRACASTCILRPRSSLCV